MKFDVMELEKTFPPVLIFGVLSFVGFIVSYRTVISMYEKLKKYEKKVLRKTKKELKKEVKEINLKAESISKKHLDIPDGPKKRTKVSKF